jgi:hypothetical protein
MIDFDAIPCATDDGQLKIRELFASLRDGIPLSADQRSLLKAIQEKPVFSYLGSEPSHWSRFDLLHVIQALVTCAQSKKDANFDCVKPSVAETIT